MASSTLFAAVLSLVRNVASQRRETGTGWFVSFSVTGE